MKENVLREEKSIELVVHGKKGVQSLVADVCDTQAKRARGLMFRQKAVPLWFIFDSERIYPIHSFFVFFKFDAVYVDKENKVTEIYKNVPSWIFLKPQRKALFLLELPAGCADELGIEIGSKIEQKLKIRPC